MKQLCVSNIFDLPASSKLTILQTLINEILTFAQVLIGYFGLR